MPQASGSPQENSGRLTIMHVSGLRSRAQETEPGEALIRRLKHELARSADGEKPRPDLIVVTGDIADGGRPGDYQQAMGFLARLADVAGIPHRHVAIVPGRHDVNHHACEAHFAWQAGEGKAPVRPYFPKWSHFAAALEEFYADFPDVTFTPDEPWTLFAMPALRVVIAGLNSTMAESHLPEDRYPLVTQAQLDWFAAKLSQKVSSGWCRLAAIHDHGARDAGRLDTVLGSSGLVSLLLSGNPDGSRELPSGVPVRVAVPGGYELVTVPLAPGRPAAMIAGTVANTAERDAYLAMGNITIWGATEAGPGRGSADRAADTFLARVAEVTRLRFPGATVTEHEREGTRYLRVTAPKDGGAIDVHPVGVIEGEASDEDLESFVRSVHSQFAAADPRVSSELVYGGTPASPELVRHARRQGVRLRSFVDYQGLLDLGPLAEAQRRRIDSDPLYPERLYIEQRFAIASAAGESTEVRSGLLAHAADWIDADAARLLVVLGDFGRGKTAFLRQLTRLLTSEFPGLSPILVQLRDLEKGPTLDDLLAQHLYRNGVHDVTKDKLRYMIDTGKVALLFDGFDELELRVGYDSAANYLQTLLNSLTGQAKVVLTSRTQHFLSTRQVHRAVRTGLGQRIETWTGTRVAILEDFTESQILEFLTSLYNGDRDRARVRLSLIGSIANLLDLTRNPRMLAFVAGLDEQRLLAVQAEGGYLTSAGLYEEIIGYWLSNEEERQQHRRGLPWLSRKERFAVCTRFALRLWRTDLPAASLHELSDQVTTTLKQLSERKFASEQATHSIASGSLLVRTGDEEFAFIHRSVMEWLVAAYAASALGDDGTARLLATRRMSRLMAAFLADLAGHEIAREWAARTLGDRAASETAKQNALAVWNQLTAAGTAGSGGIATTGRPAPRDASLDRPAGPGEPAAVPPVPLNLAGVDLRNSDLNGLVLHGANLRGATLRGMRLDGIDLSDADLTEADLTGVTMTGGSLDGAILTGSKWDQAAILGTDGPWAAPDGPHELSAAAIAGRDQADVVINTPNTEINCVAFAPDGSLLAFGSGREVKLADPGTGRVLRVLPGHQGSRHQDIVTAVAFSPDGTVLATGCVDGSAHTWDVHTGAYRTSLVKAPGGPDDSAPVAHEEPVTVIAFSPDGTAVVTASADLTVRAWDAVSGDPGPVCPVEGPVTRIAFSPDGALLATVSSRHHARSSSELSIWDLATGTRRSGVPEDGGEVHAVAFSPAGGVIAAAYHDQTVVLWDIETGLPGAAPIRHATLHGSQHIVMAIAFSPGGTVRTASHTPSWHEVRTWDATTGSQLDEDYRSTFGEQRRVNAVAFSPDLSLVATAYGDRSVCVWDVASGVQRATFSRPRPATDVAFSPDGALIAVTSADGNVRVWDAITGTGRVAFSEHPAWTGLLASSPDGTLTARRFPQDGTVQVPDTTTGIQRTVPTGQHDLVTAVAVSPDGTLLAAASQDGTVHFLDIATGTTVARLVLLDDGGLAVLRPDGSYKLAGDPSDRLWWAIKLRCFGPGELDPYIPEIRRLSDDAPILTAPLP
jgi:WD40 repeat protein